ncbi:hypothetical protein ACK386_15705, partial [Aeromonas veronii]
EYKITPCSVGQILVPCLKNVRDLALTHGLIRFNDDETLTITNLPAELRDKLRAETEVDDDE